MARRRKKGSRRKQKMPLFATAGMLVGLKLLYDAYKGGGAKNAMVALTGYDLTTGKWNYKLAYAGGAMIVGAAGSMVASKVGLNRYVKVPYVRL